MTSAVTIPSSMPGSPLLDRVIRRFWPCLRQDIPGPYCLSGQSGPLLAGQVLSQNRAPVASLTCWTFSFSFGKETFKRVWNKQARSAKN